MSWSISDARRRLAELLQAAEVSPQYVYNRKRLVGVLLGPEAAKNHLDAAAVGPAPSLAEAFGELRELCDEEGYTLHVAERGDRPNAFEEVLDAVPR